MLTIPFGRADSRKRVSSPSRSLCALTVSMLALSRLAAAQLPSPPDSLCSYRLCALTIAPTWNGLAVARGSDGARVGNLGFFVPRDITSLFEGSAVGADSALAYATRSVDLRRAGAALTDAGILAVGLTALHAIHARRFGRADAAWTGVGVVAVGASVPLQFAADGALSRALWWYNLRFAR